MVAPFLSLICLASYLSKVFVMVITKCFLDIKLPMVFYVHVILNIQQYIFYTKLYPCECYLNFIKGKRFNFLPSLSVSLLFCNYADEYQHNDNIIIIIYHQHLHQHCVHIFRWCVLLCRIYHSGLLFCILFYIYLDNLIIIIL